MSRLTPLHRGCRVSLTKSSATRSLISDLRERDPTSSRRWPSPTGAFRRLWIDCAETEDRPPTAGHLRHPPNPYNAAARHPYTAAHHVPFKCTSPKRQHQPARSDAPTDPCCSSSHGQPTPNACPSPYLRWAPTHCSHQRRLSNPLTRADSRCPSIDSRQSSTHDGVMKPDGGTHCWW